MTQPRTYYTDDITLVPNYAIWRTLRRGSFLMALPMFAYFSLRKLLRWRYSANYAVARPDLIPKVSQESVPAEVLNALMPTVETCEAAGFSVITWARGEHIGNKQSYSVLMRHETGLVAAMAVWFRIQLGQQINQRVVFGCHSFDESGVQLSTGVVADHDWISEMIPPNQHTFRLAAATSDATVIEAHLDNVAARADLMEFDSESLEQQLLVKSQELFDHMIERGFYVPITTAELKRLSAVSEVITAELA